MQLTNELIQKAATDRGGWTREQLRLIGVSWPPAKGWINRVVGTEIPDDVYAKFIWAKEVRARKRVIRDDWSQLKFY